MRGRYLTACPMRAARAALAIASATLVIVPWPARAGAPAGVAALVERMPECDRSGKYTGPSPEAAEEVIRQLLKGGRRNVKTLVGMLVEPGKGTDYRARYLLHALVLSVSRPGKGPERRLVGEALISSLDDARSANAKAYVVAELQFLGERKAIRPLGKLLGNAELCDHAARALVVLGRGAAPELARALRNSKGRNRLTIIQALGDLRDTTSVSALTPLVRDTSGEVRMAAAAALSKIADPRAIEPLAQALQKAEGYEHTQMAEACFILADNLLNGGSTSDAFKVYRRVWQTLSNKNQPQMRHAVVEGLAKGFSSERTASLIRRLRWAEPATRAAILHALGRRADPTAFGAVASAMKDKDHWVRLAAMAAIARVGKERSVPLLIDAFPGGGPHDQQVLRTALLNLPGQKSDLAMAKGLAGVRDGPRSSALRIMLLDVLATRHASEAGDAAFALTRNSDPAVRVKALKALASLAPGSLAPRLVGLMRELKRPEELKALEDAIVGSCRRITDEKRRLEPLKASLASGDVRTRCALLRVVGRIGTAQSVSVLLDALKDRETDVRDTAMRSLSDFPNDRPAPKLLEIARTSGELRHQVLAVRGLVRMAGRHRDNRKRIAMLKEAMIVAKRPEEKKLVLGGMGNVRTAEALKTVVGHLGHPGLTEEAGQAAYSIARRIYRRNRAQVKEAMEKVLAAVKGKRLRSDAAGMLKRTK